MNILLNISYDGTNYCGWQIQKNGVSIQGKIEDALSSQFDAEIKVVGAGRTDAGVHALCQKACFNHNVNVPLDKLPQVLNSLLPRDVVVTNAVQVAENFHPRFSAKTKTYTYLINNSAYPNPIYRNFMYTVAAELNFEDMRKAVKYFVGRHDFTSFCSAQTAVDDKIRTVYDSLITRNENTMKYSITGNGFLYNMVRIIVGTVLDVGKGKIFADDIPEIIASKDRKRAGTTAPALGLILTDVRYDSTKD